MGSWKKKTRTCPRWSLQSDRGEPPRAHSTVSWAVGEEVLYTEVGRLPPSPGSPSGASESPPWEVCCEKVLGSWLSQPTVKNHTFHLLGEETFQQVWMRRSEIWDVDMSCLLKQISYLPWLYLFEHMGLLWLWVLQWSRCSRLVEAGFWHSRQLEGSIFLRGRCS